MVGMEGVEPPHLSALGSKPSVSTSSTTSPDSSIIEYYYFMERLILKIINYSQFQFFSSFEGSKAQNCK